MSERKPWHRQPGESAKAFHAFMLYRDMPTRERSIQRVLETTDKKPSYYRHLARLSSRHQWVERVKAYDEHLAEVRAEAQIKAIKEMAERQAKLGMALQSLGIQKYLGADGKLDLTKVTSMKDRDAIAAIEVGAKLERVARGEPTEIAKQDVTVKPGKPLAEYTNEELEWTIEHKLPIEAKYQLEAGKE